MIRSLIVSLTSGFSVILLQYYLHLNIINFLAGNVGVIYLGLFAISLLVARLLCANSLKPKPYIKTTDIYLIIFFLLVFIKIAVEHPGENQIFAHSLGSSGGILFYLALGLLLGFNPLFQGNKLSANIFILGKRSIQSPFINLANLVPSIAIIFSSLQWTYQEFILFNSSLRTDLFLVDDRLVGGDLSYQRIGDFITVKLIAVVLTVASAIFSHSETKKISITYNSMLLFDLFFTVLGILSCVFAFLTSLVIGSNKAAVLSVLSLIIIFYACAVRHGLLALFISSRITLFIDAFLKLRPVKVVKYLLLCLTFLAPLISIFAFVFNHDFFSQTRLTRFGDESGALGPRIDILLNNTIAQFDVAPLFGNMYADGLSTGPGTYVHSLPIFLLTHTGLLGLILFCLFMIGNLRSISKSLICIYCNISGTLKNRYQEGQYIAKLVYGQIGLFVLSFALLMAIVGTSLFWGFLWFAIGLSFGISRLQSVF